MQPMVVDKRAAKLEFASRLTRALALAGIPDDQNRRGWIARTFGVSVEAARKWLVGESMPDTARIQGIAQELGVAANWLLSGQDEPDGPKIAESGAPRYVLAWRTDTANAPLERAIDRAYRTGSLTPQLAQGIAAMLDAISEPRRP